MAKLHSQRITLDDVAQLVGVSSQTVSRVVNDHPYVSDDTRQRVQDAIRQLNYRPNRAARSLVTQRTDMLAIISFGTHHFGPAQMMNHIEHVARQQGYRVSYANLSVVSPGELYQAMAVLGDHSVDGVVFITPVAGVDYADLTRVCCDVPFVQIDTQLGAQIPSVVIDQHYGTHLVVQHLINLGHRAFCEISGPLNWFGAQARHQSWLDTLDAARLTPGLSVEGDWTAKSGYEAAQRLVSSGTEFTALVVANDQMALGAIRALRERGLRIPEAVSVVGFDDIPEAAYFEPPLTTVRQNFAALGEQSVEYLMALINNPDTPVHQRVLYPQFIERQSTGIPG